MTLPRSIENIMSSMNTTSSEEKPKRFEEFDNNLCKEREKFEERWHQNFSECGVLTDFLIIKTISEGSFGKVVLAKYKPDILRLIALKILDKAHIVQTKQVQHIHAEIRVMDAVKFPFLIHLEFFFKSNCYLFIGMSYINGGELYSYLRHEKRLSETQTQFYAAQMILAFEYLHFMGIVYRDLKPENVLIDKEGYLKLTDYGFSKKINENRTWTLCGTPEYLAPEIILSIGYNKSVDWWTIGVFIYEMAAGFTPFYDKDVLKMYEKIAHGKFQYPSNFSSPLKHIVGRLLQVDKSKRLGALKAGPKDIKNHEFFRAVNWDDIFNRKIIAAYKPNVSGPDDTSQFQKTDEIIFRTNENEEYPELFKVISVHK